jgi:hypothetical protein
MRSIFKKENILIYIVFLYAFLIRLPLLTAPVTEEARTILLYSNCSFFHLIFSNIISHHIVSSLVLKVFSKFSIEIYILRLPFLLIGMLSIYQAYILSLEVFNKKKIAQVLAVIISISLWHMQFSTVARDYIFMFFFIILALKCYRRVLKDPGFRNFSYLGLYLQLIIYSMPAAIISVLAMMISLLFIALRRNKEFMKKVFVFVAMMFVLLGLLNGSRLKLVNKTSAYMGSRWSNSVEVGEYTRMIKASESLKNIPFQGSMPSTLYYYNLSRLGKYGSVKQIESMKQVLLEFIRIFSKVILPFKLLFISPLLLIGIWLFKYKNNNMYTLFVINTVLLFLVLILTKKVYSLRFYYSYSIFIYLLFAIGINWLIERTKDKRNIIIGLLLLFSIYNLFFAKGAVHSNRYPAAITPYSAYTKDYLARNIKPMASYISGSISSDTTVLFGLGRDLFSAVLWFYMPDKEIRDKYEHFTRYTKEKKNIWVYTNQYSDLHELKEYYNDYCKLMKETKIFNANTKFELLKSYGHEKIYKVIN